MNNKIPHDNICMRKVDSHRISFPLRINFLTGMTKRKANGHLYRKYDTIF